MAAALVAVLAPLALDAAPHAAAGTAAGWTVSRLPLAPHAAYSFSEPGVAAGAGGLLVANACTANSGSPSTFWRSTDFGRTWSAGFPVGSSAIGCGDSDAAVGGHGWVYSLTLGTGVSVYRSPDGGRHWHGPASFPPPHGADQPDRPWLVVPPHHPGQVLMFNSEVGGNIVMWRSTDHAATFAGPTLVTGGLNSQTALALGSRPLVDPGRPSRLSLFYETAGGAAATQPTGVPPGQFPLSQLWVATSDDLGRHWTNTLVLDVATAFGVSQGSLGHLLPASAVDPAGHVFVVVSARLGDSTATHLFLVHSAARGWSRPTQVDRGMPSNVFPAVAATGIGRLAVSWYASSARDFNDPSARWVEKVATTKRVTSAAPAFRRVQLSGARPVHVGAIDSAGAIGNDLGANWALRDFQSVTVDSCGHPHVTWAADYRQHRTYAATTLPFCAPQSPAGRR